MYIQKLHSQENMLTNTRSFYTLSKRHHPDHNPNDPTAKTRFMRISEAYAVLSSQSRRAAYDRDVLRLHTPQAPHHQNRSPGSYHSATNPAGGRPASGLSKRRSTFRGPPPSFYRNGGWGEHAEKRRAAHEDSTTSPSSSANTSSPNDPRQSQYPQSDPLHRAPKTPHFDPSAHQRTQSAQDARRASRRHRENSSTGNSSRSSAADDDGPGYGSRDDEPPISAFGHFVVISCILLSTLLVPLALVRGKGLQPGKRKDG
jgi:curved DNA-binding protein CbpA